MNCEVCKVIEKLGLDMSAHDMWFCVDGQSDRRDIEFSVCLLETNTLRGHINEAESR